MAKPIELGLVLEREDAKAFIDDIEVRQEAVSRIAVNPPSYPFKMSLPWHAILVTRWCEALGTMWKRMGP
jgi:hypothetical protein